MWIHVDVYIITATEIKNGSAPSFFLLNKPNFFSVYIVWIIICLEFLVLKTI